MIGTYVAMAGLNGMALVGLAAYGAHGLEQVDMAYRAQYQTGWQLHAVHAAVLVAIAMSSRPNRWLHSAFWLLAIGTAVFCLPLYGPALGIWVPSALLAPVGGFVLIVGWFAMVLAGVSRTVSKMLGPSQAERARIHHHGWLPSDTEPR